MNPLPPGLPPGLYDMQRDLAEQMQPTKPHAVCALAQADLPPAASWPNCLAWVSDLLVLAVSDGTAWRRTDTGAAI